MVKSASGLVEGIIIQKRVAGKREFLMTKARAEELRAAEAEAWKRPSSSARPSSSVKEEGVQPEPVDEQPQPDVADTDMTLDPEKPDTDATRRMRISTKRPGPWNAE